MGIEKKLDIVVTPFVTPFKDGLLDIEGQKSVVRNSRANGITWEFYLGRNGEERFLMDDDCRRVIDSVSEMMESGINIMVGVTRPTFRRTADMLEYALRKGIKIIVLAPDYQDELPGIEFVRRVMDTTEANVFVYRIPGSRNIFPGDITVLAEQYGKRIEGVKDSTGVSNDMDELLIVREMFPHLLIFQGSEEAKLKRPQGKENGLVSGTSNFDQKNVISLMQKIGVGNYGIEPEATVLRGYHAIYSNDGNDSVPEIKNRLHAAKLIASPELAPNNPKREYKK